MSFHYWRKPRPAAQDTLHYAGQQLPRRDVGRTGGGQCRADKSLYKPLLMDVLTAPSPNCYFRDAGESWE